MLWIDSQLFFGSIKARADIIACYSRIDRSGNLPCKEIHGLHIIECKRDWAAFQAFGQLLLYKEITQRYLKSRHYDAFNLDYNQGVNKFYSRNRRIPFGWKQSFWLSNEIVLSLHLALLKTGYVDNSFLKFVEGSLDSFLEGVVGLVLIERHGGVWRSNEKRSPSPIKLSRTGGPKPKHWFEAAKASLIYETRTDCRIFSKEGKRNNWCTDINPVKCESCEWYVPV